MKVYCVFIVESIPDPVFIHEELVGIYKTREAAERSVKDYDNVEYNISDWEVQE